MEATRATETDALEAALKTAETVSAASAKAAADALTEKESIIAAYARRHEVKVNQAAAMSASLEKSREEAKALAARLARAEQDAALEKRRSEDAAASLEAMTREKDAAKAEHARSLDAARLEKAERDEEVGALRSSLEEVRAAVQEAKAETARAVRSAETGFELEMESARCRASDAEAKSARHEAARIEAEACVARQEAARVEREMATKASVRAAEDAREEIERLTSTLAKETEKSSRFASEAVRARSELAQAQAEAGASSAAAAQSAWTDVVADLRARLEAAETSASRSAAVAAKTEKARAESERASRDAESAARDLRAELSSARAEAVTARAEAATARATVEVERRRLDETTARVTAVSFGSARHDDTRVNRKRARASSSPERPRATTASAPSRVTRDPSPSCRDATARAEPSSPRNGSGDRASTARASATGRCALPLLRVCLLYTSPSPRDRG